MKLLLTSGGLTNKSIEKELFELVGKKPGDTSLVFIPTASNVEMGDKDWFINDLINIHKQNFKSVSMADISAVPENIWRPQLEEADVLFFEGGNTYHLMRWIKESGLVELLPELLKTRVWAGISAGSMVTTRDLSVSQSKKLYYDGMPEGEDEKKGLGFLDLHFRPHLNSPHFKKVRKEFLEPMAKELQGPLYALDDMSALKIIDGKIEIISEGEYLVLNK